MFRRVILLLISFFCIQGFAKKTLYIGVEGAYPPFSSVNEKGELVGFDIDIAQALCADMQVQCTLVKIDWDGLIPSLANEQIDAIVASMSATDERKQRVDFTDKYYSNTARILAKKSLSEQITEQNFMEKLKGKRLGVQTATAHDRYATDKLANIVASIERYNTQDEANFDLVAGRIDATIADQIALSYGFLNGKLGENFSLAAPLINDKEYYGSGISIAVRKGDNALREAFNNAIKHIRSNDEYKKINDKYFTMDVY